MALPSAMVSIQSQYHYFTPEQIATLHTPSEDVAPDLTKWPKYARRLYELGLHAKAFRAREEGEWWRHYKDKANETWRESISNSMLRTAPHHARQLARAQENKYRHLEPYITKVFTFGRFRFLERDPDEAQATLRTLRALIEDLFPGLTVDKVGEDSHFNILKFMATQPIDAALAGRIRARTPTGVFFETKVHYKDSFFEVLRLLVAPDLPPAPENRAELELRLTGVHQVKLHGATRAEHGKFVYDPAYTNLGDYVDPKTVKRIPKNPKTGLPAMYMSRVVDKGTLAEQIPAGDWIRLPDYASESPQSPPL